MKCVICNSKLSGKQQKYCSSRCKNRDTNNRHQSYLAQQARGRKRKLGLIEIKGGQCELCGYCKNYAALEFHHKDSSTKSFQLDLRSLSNRNWDKVLEELDKCRLLCSNCHAEIHNPDCELP